ncbi:hypothetical protein DdX_19572 [Ditylenchus destructor]|uniref:Uncharacterized protein n=1 Tax=Ditylenchus destructor TaxID=166010 RepID=A0AAD4MHP4_9BILA|nr:hypothetical protein DdX_19572 [Ditylenchus destructor]
MATRIILFLSCIGLALLQFAGANELKSFDFDFNMEYYDSKENTHLANGEHLETAIKTMLHAAQEKLNLEDKKKCVKGIWFLVHPEITLLWKEGFRFHLAVDQSLKMPAEYTDVVIMKKSFLPPNLDTVPLHLPNEGGKMRAKADMMIYCIVTVQAKSDHSDYKWKPRHELNEKMSEKPEGKPDEKSMISTGNWNAILAADGWHAQWKTELANKSNKLELFFNDNSPDLKKQSSITYAFYRTPADWKKITHRNPAH